MAPLFGGRVPLLHCTCSGNLAQSMQPLRRENRPKRCERVTSSQRPRRENRPNSEQRATSSQLLRSKRTRRKGEKKLLEQLRNLDPKFVPENGVIISHTRTVTCSGPDVWCCVSPRSETFCAGLVNKSLPVTCLERQDQHRKK